MKNKPSQNVDSYTIDIDDNYYKFIDHIGNIANARMLGGGIHLLGSDFFKARSNAKIYQNFDKFYRLIHKIFLN